MLDTVEFIPPMANLNISAIWPSMESIPLPTLSTSDKPNADNFLAFDYNYYL